MIGFALSLFGAGVDASNFVLSAFVTSGAAAPEPATAFGAGTGLAIALASRGAAAAAVVRFDFSGADAFAI